MRKFLYYVLNLYKFYLLWTGVNESLRKGVQLLIPVLTGIKRNIPLNWRHTSRWEDNINMYLQEIRWGRGLDWSRLGQGQMAGCCAYVSEVTVSINGMNFLISWEIIGSLRMTLLRIVIYAAYFIWSDDTCDIGLIRFRVDFVIYFHEWW
jgi:hypothetical protein